MDTEIFEKILNENQHFREMARIGNVGDYIISVFSDEGPVPHFHFFNTKTRTRGCIKILECAYFKHGKYKASLNSTEKKELYQFLITKVIDDIYKPGTTNFKVICSEWNRNNPESKVDLNTPMPDYRKL